MHWLAVGLSCRYASCALLSSSRMTWRRARLSRCAVLPGDARRRRLGELVRPAAFEEHDLAEAPELEVLRNGERIDEGDQHPFARLVEGVDVADDRQIDRRGRHLGEMVAGVGDDDRAGRAGGDLGHTVELRDDRPLP